MEPDTITSLAKIFNEFGPVGGGLLLLGWTMRKVVLWLTPHVEAVITAHIKRQASMARCQEKLTDSTIEIQRQSLGILTGIRDKLPSLCQAQCPLTKEEEG